MNELLSESPFDRRCAADLARRISARQPGILRRYADVLIDLFAEIPLAQWQTRGYLSMAAALNASTHAQRMRLALLVRPMVADPRNAVRAMGLESLALVAVPEPALRDEVLHILERARREGTCAMRSRACRMLPLVLAAEAIAIPE
jgi:hypothetical protein